MGAAAKQRAYRQRLRKGLTVYRVPLPPDNVLALIVSGRLTEAEAMDRKAVERELATVQAEWSRRWLQK